MAEKIREIVRGFLSKLIGSTLFFYFNLLFSGTVIESVTFVSNSKLTTINDYAFRNCINLKEIQLPKSLKKIDFKKVFENCKEIKIEIKKKMNIIELKMMLFIQKMKVE